VQLKGLGKLKKKKKKKNPHLGLEPVTFLLVA
jgi:hypothetical protein